MSSGYPPASHAFVRGTAALDIERGSLREYLGGLRNLAQLLHSLRVGSRPLSSVLPDVLSACDPLRHAMGEILAAARASLQAEEAADELNAYVSPRIDEVITSLTGAMGRPLSVKMRLQLEASMSRLSQELDTARGLFELLVDAISGPAMRLDVLELARQSFAGPPSGGSWPRDSLVASLCADSPGLEVEVNPRVAMALIAFGVEFVANPTDPSRVPHIRVTASAAGGCEVHVGLQPGGLGEEVVLLTRGLIGPTLPCVTATAGANGAVLSFDSAERNFSLAFGRAFPGRMAGEAG